MAQKVLLSFHEVSHRFADEAWDLQQFSWNLHYGECVQLTCERDEQYQALWRLLQKNLKPKYGSIEALRPVSYASDEAIASRLNPQATMNQTLQSKLFADHLWANGKRLHVQSALEALQIPLSERHKPIHRVAPVARQRFLALLFMAAQVKLLLGQKVFQTMDEVTLDFFQKWCPYFWGALVIFGEAFVGAGVVDVFVEIDATGQGRVRG